MTTATVLRRTSRASGVVGTSLCLLLTGLVQQAAAIAVDGRGEMNLSLRSYVAVRIGTQQVGGEDNPLSFPDSAPGHLRQNRFFLQLDWDHDLKRLAKTSWGLAALGRWWNPSVFKYTLQYRGEGEGIYDWGPDEYSESGRTTRRVRFNLPEIPGLVSRTPNDEYVDRRVRRLNRNARQRNQLFLAYLDVEKGPVFVRIGKQILAWGETDVFRLLDNINPLDDSFGGFFISLDERRVPLEMVRSSYNFGSFGPVADAFLEGFVATGHRVSQIPGTPAGSPWAPGGIAYPNQSIRQSVEAPDATDVRGGARLVFSIGDVTATLAHYYTYLDIPGTQFKLPARDNNAAIPNSAPVFGNEIIAFARYPRVPITGGAVTFPLSSLYSIVRSEAAYFQGEPMSRQGKGNPAFGVAPLGSPQAKALRRQKNTEGGVNPFVYPGFFDIFGREKPVWGTVLQRDTFNYSLGLDVNRFIRFLNPHQTFFFSTQFFFRHVFDSPGDLVLPSTARNIRAPWNYPILGAGVGAGCNKKRQPDGTFVGTPCRAQPRFYHLDDNRFLHTLLITTSYSSGRIVPFYGMFYDWQGGIVFQPGVTLVRDPFRVTFDYTRVEAAMTGQFGAVRDRDNVRFQFEFVF